MILNSEKEDSNGIIKKETVNQDFGTIGTEEYSYPLKIKVEITVPLR